MLMTKKESLLANRRGVVENFTDQEKPIFSPEELIENRRRGISFSCIGKKLGIDNTKEEVVNVFKVMKECDNTLPNVEQLQSPIVKTFPTPLWILFESEINLIASECTPPPPYSAYFSHCCSGESVQQVRRTSIRNAVYVHGSKPGTKGRDDYDHIKCE